MADDKTGSAKENGTTEQAEPKKSKKLLWILLAVVVAAGGGGGATVFFMMGGKSEAAEAVEAAPAQPPGLVAMDTFLVNLSDPGGDRYMKLTLRLTISPVLPKGTRL